MQVNFIFCQTIAATGAIQLAKAIATPIPQYAEGTKSKPTDGPAIVGEKGTELVIEPGKKPYLTPDKATYVPHLPKRTTIIPNDELLKYAYAMPGFPSWRSDATDKYSEAMLSKFDNNTDAIKALRKEIRRMPMARFPKNATYYKTNIQTNMN